uniref:Chemosensory protein 1 n=1 Tax=Pachypeltis micranthus TaxID=1983339 RepID=A0A1W6QYJ1_9HEMI|nr:chemosensory protein 1 [Pachypeltis micranthus]
MAGKLLFVFIFAVALSGALTAELYTTKYDNIDIEDILNNERLYQKYFDCLRSSGKCTADGQYLKEVLPDALQTECSKCSDKQKHGAEKVLRFMLTKKPEDYQVLENIFDKESIYRKKYEEQKRLATEGKPIEY